MADRAFNSYPGAPSIAGDETLLIAQGGVTLNTTPDQILQAGLVPTFGDTTVRNLIFTANQSVSNVLAAPTATPGIPVWRQLSTDDIGGMGVFFSSPPPIGDVTPNLVYSSGGALNGTVGATAPNTGAFTALSGLVTATNSPTSRTLADRAADWINVKDFGAALNGTTNDSAAFQTAMTAAGNGGSIVVPAGGWVVTTTPTLAGNVLWKLSGNKFGTGNTPVQYFTDGDVVETFLSGRKFFGKQITAATDGYGVVEVNLKYQNTSGGAGTQSGLVVNASAAANVGSASVSAITAITQNAANTGGPSYGAFFTNYKSGTTASFGLAVVAEDKTGLATSAGGNTTNEISVYGNLLDDKSGGGRILLNLTYGRSNTNYSAAPFSLHTGLAIGPTTSAIATNASLDRAVSFDNVIYNNAGLDFRLASPASSAAHAMWLTAGQDIAFSTDGSRTLGYVTADTALEYKVGGTTRWSVSDAGIMSASALATGGTTARTLAAIFADQNNVKSQGAVGDGTTVDLAALTGTTMPAYLPGGTYFTNAAFGFLNPSGGIRRWFAGSGGGNILTSEGPQAGNIMFVKAAPSYPGPGTSITNMFNGSMQNHLGFQTYIAGAATLGQPTTGYVVNPAVASILGAIFNTSGWNNSTNTASGRTGMHGMFFNLQQGGNGDLIGFGVNGIITGVRAGATYFLGSPVVGVINGDIKAGVDNCYLDPAEIFCRDQGFQSAAFGMVRNMQRDATVAGGKVSQDWPWAGIFLQSTGATAIDAFFAMTGPAAIGIDFACVSGGFKDTSGNPTNAAATLRAGMRLYGNATNPGSGAGGTSQIPSYTTPGTEWLSYETSTGWGFVVGSASVFNANATAITASKNLIRKAATADQSADVYVATAAGSRTIPDGCSWECLTPAATIATFTTTMPAAQIDKQEVWISTTQTITTWTLNPNTGQSINGAPTTLGANTSVQFRYNLATTTWFRML